MQTLVPLECVCIRLEIHGALEADVVSISMEASDPHTKELLAIRVDPSYPRHARRRAAEDAGLHVRNLLLDLLDPDPF